MLAPKSAQPRVKWYSEIERQTDFKFDINSCIYYDMSHIQ